MEGFALLPAAITMVAGPQIISAVVLATSSEPKRNSLAFIAGVTTAVVLGTLAALGLVQVLSGAANRSGGSGADKWVTYALVALLAYAAVRAFLGRKTSKPPKWLTGLQTAKPASALKIGFLLFLLMPTDLIMMLSVAGYLTKNDLAFWQSLPFVLLTLLFISLPFLTYLLLGKRADEVLPGIRDWMNEYSWAINIGICVYFIYSLLK